MEVEQITSLVSIFSFGQQLFNSGCIDRSLTAYSTASTPSSPPSEPVDSSAAGDGKHGAAGTAGLEGAGDIVGLERAGGTVGLDGTAGTAGLDGAARTAGLEGIAGTMALDGTAVTAAMEVAAGTVGLEEGGRATIGLGPERTTGETRLGTAAPTSAFCDEGGTSLDSADPVTVSDTAGTTGIQAGASVAELTSPVADPPLDKSTTPTPASGTRETSGASLSAG